MNSPIRGYYVPQLWAALFSLVPDILVAGGTFIYEQDLIKDLHTSETALAIIQGLNIAGYAFGAMLTRGHCCSRASVSLVWAPGPPSLPDCLRPALRFPPRCSAVFSP
ncbi:MAG: hypothetical protein ACRECV_11930 [Xanthobacteraceae bacterium]